MFSIGPPIQNNRSCKIFNIVCKSTKPTVDIRNCQLTINYSRKDKNEKKSITPVVIFCF